MIEEFRRIRESESLKQVGRSARTAGSPATTALPSSLGAVLEIPALIGMVVYGVLYWLSLRLMWVIFDPAKIEDANKYDPDL